MLCVGVGAQTTIGVGVGVGFGVNNTTGILIQPSNKSIDEGDNAVFSITVRGTYAYQWQVNNGITWSNISNGGAYSGANTNILSITVAPETINKYLYRCLLYQNSILKHTSNSASLNMTYGETNTYIAAVRGDGGVIVDSSYVNELMYVLKKNSMYTRARIHISPNAGVKYDGSNRIEKIYSIVNNMHPVQATDNNKPIFVSSDTAFNNRAVFSLNGSTQFMQVANFVANLFLDVGHVAKYTGYFNFEQGAIFVTAPGFGFFGQDVAANIAVSRNISGTVRAKYGEAVKIGVGQKGLFSGYYNNINSLKYYIGETEQTITPLAGSLALETANSEVTATLNLWCRNGASLFATGRGADFYVYDSLTDAQRLAIISYVNSYYFETINYEEVFTGTLNYSTYQSNGITYVDRNALGVFDFYTTSDILRIKALPGFTCSPTSYNKILIDVDGVKTMQYVSSSGYFDYNIGALGVRKRIKITEGAQSDCATATIQGVTIQSILQRAGNEFSQNYDTEVTKYCFIGNSITVGASATNYLYEGYAMLWRAVHPSTSVFGFGYATMADYASTVAKIDSSVSVIKRLLTGTTNYLVIALGTNDYGLSACDTTNFRKYYDSLLVNINRESGIDNLHIYCLSPIIRGNEVATNTHGINIQGYRDAIPKAVSGKNYATYIDAKGFVSVGNLTDGVHPSTVGHKQYYDSLSVYLP